MAYIDQRTGGNQRAVAMTVVALIQGTAVIALINGLAVKWIVQDPPPRTEGEQIKLEPIPTPLPPPPKPPIDQRRTIEDPLPRLPLPTGTTRDPLPPMPLPPDPVPTSIADPLPPPQPTPSFTPRAPKPRNAPGNWATTNDYPARDLREGNQGVVAFALQVGADGRVLSCSVTGSSGFAGLDKATCDNVARRARFEAATDGSGNRVAGTYNGRIRWQIPQD